jgi:preprotein translocase subunit SecG
LFVAWVVFHVVVCVALILVVLMQSAKGEGLAGATAFGGGMSSAVFGGRGAASFLSKATTVLAIVFMINCGALALLSSNARIVAGGGEATTGESAVTRQAQEAQQQAMERQAAAAQSAQSVNADSLYNAGGDSAQVTPLAPPTVTPASNQATPAATPATQPATTPATPDTTK